MQELHTQVKHNSTDHTKELLLEAVHKPNVKSAVLTVNVMWWLTWERY